MTRFVVGDDRNQSTLFPERLDDYLGGDNPVRAIDVFVDELDLAKLGFGGVEPEATGRPAYHPATLLKIYVYGYARFCLWHFSDLPRCPQFGRYRGFRGINRQKCRSNCLPRLNWL